MIRPPFATGLVLLFALALALPGGAAAKGRPAFVLTHQVSVTGQLVDHWTIAEADSDPTGCHVVGSGSVTVTFATKRPALASPRFDRSAGNEVPAGGGSWIMFAPDHGHAVDHPPIPVRGSIVRVDDTVNVPGAERTEPCPVLDKSGCGTFALGRAATVAIGRFDVHHVTAELRGEDLEARGDAACHVGNVTSWDANHAVVGGGPSGQLLVAMPSQRRFDRKRDQSVSGSATQASSFGDPGRGTTTSNVTRTAKVSFHRVRR